VEAAGVGDDDESSSLLARHRGIVAPDVIDRGRCNGFFVFNVVAW
jgi:hypothetical protein